MEIITQGTTIMSTQEYDRLKNIERMFNELSSNPDRLLITNGYFSQYVASPTHLIKEVIESKNRAEAELKQLKEKQLPRFLTRKKNSRRFITQ